jgi:hypothetical protein
MRKTANSATAAHAHEGYTWMNPLLLTFCLTLLHLCSLYAPPFLSYHHLSGLSLERSFLVLGYWARRTGGTLESIER